MSSFFDESVEHNAGLETPATEVDDLELPSAKSPDKAPPKPTTTHILVNTYPLVRAMIDKIKRSQPQALYIDAEGIDLSKTGELTTLQVFLETERDPIAYIMDVYALKKIGPRSPFHIAGRRWRTTTLQSILEDPTIPKLLWDCRMDSEALFHQFGVALTSVIDIQLMEVVRRNSSRNHLGAYVRAVQEDIRIDAKEAYEMLCVKNTVQRSFIPSKGGDWNVLKKRPMSEKLIEYCIADIKYMPLLFRKYAADIEWCDSTEAAREEVSIEGVVPRREDYQLKEPMAFFGEVKGKQAVEVLKYSTERIQRSQKERWARGRNMSISPWWMPYADDDDCY